MPQCHSVNWPKQLIVSKKIFDLGMPSQHFTNISSFIYLKLYSWSFSPVSSQTVELSFDFYLSLIFKIPMEFSRLESWSGWPFPSPGHPPNPGIKPRSLALQVDSLSSEPQGKPIPSPVHPGIEPGSPALQVYRGPAPVGSSVSEEWMVRRERYIDLERDKERISN